MDPREHAVIVGASIAGLLAAAATARHYTSVTILERETLPAPGEARRGIPQGRHVHAFLPGGLVAVDQLLPGLPAEMVAAGAVRCESMREIRALIGGHTLCREAQCSDNLLASRPFFEGQIRQRVLALPNVNLTDGVGVTALVGDRHRVRGVRTNSLGDITADLVVVSTGRAGHLPRWLEQLGLQAPPVQELEVDLLYASRHLAMEPGALSGDKMVFIAPAPGLARGLGLFAQEDGTWLLTAVGWGKQNHPPIDIAGHRAFIESFAPLEVCAAIRGGTDLDQVVTHAFPASRRRRYDRMSSFPNGLVVIGDAISSFNPAYGQGMSVAALEALGLDRCLEAGPRRLARRYFRAIRTPVNAAWDQAIGADLALPEIAGHRPLSVRLGNAWVDRVLAAAEYDAKVAERFAAVTDLIASPTALFGPTLVWRVLRGHGSGKKRAMALVSPQSPGDESLSTPDKLPDAKTIAQ